MVSRVSSGSSFRDLTAYLTDRGERVEWVSAHGEVSADPYTAADQMQAFSSLSKAEKPVLHISVSFAEGDLASAGSGQAWGSQERAEKAVAAVLEKAGLSGHQALLVAHNDKGHPHVHVMLNRVSPATGGAWDMDWHRLKIRLAVEAVEREQGFKLTGRNVLSQGKDIPVRMTRNEWDVEQAGRRSFPRVVREDGGDALRNSSSWAELHRELSRVGLHIERTTRGGVVKGEDGRTVSLSRVGKGVSLPKLERRLGPYTEPLASERTADQTRGTKGLGTYAEGSAVESYTQPHSTSSSMAATTTSSPDPARSPAAPSAYPSSSASRIANDQSALQHAQAARAADRDRKGEARAPAPRSAPEPPKDSLYDRSGEVGKAAAAVGASGLNRQDQNSTTKEQPKAFDNDRPARSSSPTSNRLPGEIEGARKLPNAERFAEGQAAAKAGKSDAEVVKAFNKYGVEYDPAKKGDNIRVLKDPVQQKPQTPPSRTEPEKTTAPGQRPGPDARTSERSAQPQPQAQKDTQGTSGPRTNQRSEPSASPSKPGRESVPASGSPTPQNPASARPPVGAREQPGREQSAGGAGQAGRPTPPAATPNQGQAPSASTQPSRPAGAEHLKSASSDKGTGDVRSSLKKGASAVSTISRVSDDDFSKLRAAAGMVALTYRAGETAYQAAKVGHRGVEAIKAKATKAEEPKPTRATDPASRGAAPNGEKPCTAGPTAGEPSADAARPAAMSAPVNTQQPGKAQATSSPAPSGPDRQEPPIRAQKSVAPSKGDTVHVADAAARPPVRPTPARMADPVVSKLHLDAEKAGRGGQAQRLLPGAVREAGAARGEAQALKVEGKKGISYSADLRTALAKTYRDPAAAERALRTVAEKGGISAVRDTVANKPRSLGAIKEEPLRAGNMFKDRTKPALDARMSIVRPAEVVLRHEKSLAGRSVPQAETAAKSSMAQVKAFQTASALSTPAVRSDLASRFSALSKDQKQAFRGVASTEARAQIVIGKAEQAVTKGKSVEAAVNKVAGQVSGPGTRFASVVKGAQASPGTDAKVVGLAKSEAISLSGTAAVQKLNTKGGVVRSALGQVKEISSIARGDSANGKEATLKAAEKSAMVIPKIGPAVSVAINAARKTDRFAQKQVATGQER